MNNSNSFPKNIWIYWEQGIDNAPPFAQFCLQSWITKNNTWNIKTIDKNNLSEFFNIFDIIPHFLSIEPIQHRSDIIRTILLQKYGGIWVDMTIYCKLPLDKWFFEHLNGQEFFLFTTSKLTIANWFIASYPNSYFINKIYEKFIGYFLKNKKSNEYLLFHSYVNKFIKTDKKFLNNFKKSKRLDAYNARIYDFYFNIINNNNFSLINFLKLTSPIFKLSSSSNILNITKFINFLSSSDNIPLPIELDEICKKNISINNNLSIKHNKLFFIKTIKYK
jgi:hypothetical protein